MINSQSKVTSIFSEIRAFLNCASSRFGEIIIEGEYMKAISLIVSIFIIVMLVRSIVQMIKIIFKKKENIDMTVNGNLVGVNMITSKKGTDCFFGNVLTEFDTNREKNGIGKKVVQICAFGEDAVELYAKCNKNGLVEEDVTVKGIYQGSVLQATDIQLS